MLDRGEFDSKLWAFPQVLWLLGAILCLTHFLDRFAVALGEVSIFFRFFLVT